MIVFDLICAPGGHRFEGWFAGSHAFVDQKSRGLLMCPTCGSAHVDKAAMAPRVGRKGNQGAVARPGAATPESPAVAMRTTPDDPRAAAVAAMMAKVAAVQAEMLPKSTWVGRDFADTARAMHDGTIDAGLIHGQTTADEAQALHDDGVGIVPLLVPFVPPEAQN
ncbi:MAG: hypothetical protein RLZZ58_1972 [Pseudomonadota bacterium]